MTHSLSLFAADEPPAMYRNATLAMLVSSTSMNVAIDTAIAMNQGLTVGLARPVPCSTVAPLIGPGLRSVSAPSSYFRDDTRSGLSTHAIPLAEFNSREGRGSTFFLGHIKYCSYVKTWNLTLGHYPGVLAFEIKTTSVPKEERRPAG